MYHESLSFWIALIVEFVYPFRSGYDFENKNHIKRILFSIIKKRKRMEEKDTWTTLGSGSMENNAKELLLFPYKESILELENKRNSLYFTNFIN